MSTTNTNTIFNTDERPFIMEVEKTRINDLGEFLENQFSSQISYYSSLAEAEESFIRTEGFTTALWTVDNCFESYYDKHASAINSILNQSIPYWGETVLEKKVKFMKILAIFLIQRNH